MRAFGFIPTPKGQSYSRPIMEGQFVCAVTLSDDGVDVRVLESDTDEEYHLFRVKDAVGGFVGQMREEAELLLKEIAATCCKREIFKSEQTKRLISYAKKAYGDEVEHLWADTPENGILRRKDSQKWYAAILTVSAKRLGLAFDEKVEVVNLHTLPEKLPTLLDGASVFLGYHMNKKHWYSVLLDGSIADERLFALVDESYRLSKK